MINLPKDVTKLLGWRFGDFLLITIEPNGILKIGKFDVDKYRKYSAYIDEKIQYEPSDQPNSKSTD